VASAQMQMMSGWLRHLELTFKSKTGLGAGVIAWGLIALLGAAATVVFLIVAGFVALAERYGPLVAALALGGLFLLITVVAVVGCLSSRRQTAAAAQLALAARSQAPWLDPRYLGVGIQIGRAIGWRRLVPLAAVGVLAAGLAKEWIGRSRTAGD
jgi:hypothetical protein